MKRSLFLFIFLAACAPKGRDLTTDVGTLIEGDRLASDEFFDEARKQYNRIKTEFPRSALQSQADYKIAESYYNEENYQSAANAFEEFIKTYPTKPEVVDALYKVGMSYVNQMPSTPQRDARATHKVVDTFTRLMIDYPDNKYRGEGEQHISRARNQLAEKIYEIGRFYERQGDYAPAARRFGEVADHYAELALAEESMARQANCYKKAGNREKFEEASKAFLEKFPNSKFVSYVK